MNVHVSVHSNVLKLGCTNHYPGGISDFQLIPDNEELHKQQISQRDSEQDIPDDYMVGGTNHD